jgi:hypothetical protein
MRRGAAGLAALGAAVFVLAAWVTTATSLPIIRGVVPSDTHPAPQRRPTIDRSIEPIPPKTHTSDGGFDLDLTVLLYALLILLLVALAVLLVRRIVFRRRVRRLRRQAVDVELEGDDWELTATEGLARSAARGLLALTDGEPRNAIVQCWTELEDAVAQLGLPRDPALTSEEFTSGVLSRYSVDRAEIETLGALYREARFSQHRMSERHRAAAIEALTALRDGLRRASSVDDTPATTDLQP